MEQTRRLVGENDNHSASDDDEDWEEDDEEPEGGDAFMQYGLKAHRLTIAELGIDIDKEDINSGIFAKAVYDSFMPYQRFMQILFRYPCGSSEKNGVFEFSFEKTKPYAIGFCIMSSIVFIVSLLVVVNGVGILLGHPTHTATVNGRDPSTLRLEEHFLLRRNAVPVIILVTSLVHVTIANFSFFFKRHFACNYLSFWTQAAEIMRIDVAAGLHSFMWWTMLTYGSFLAIFSLLCAIQFAPVSTGGPAILTMLTFRVFVPHIHAVDSFFIIRGIFSFVFLYILISAKSYVFLFLYYTKLLKNGFVTWNHRLDVVLHGGGEPMPRIKKVENRIGFDHLFKDYVCLLDLLAGIDTLFANIVESYFVTQMFSVLFEVFYCIKSVTAKNEFTSVRSMDLIIMLLYVASSLWIFFLVSNAAAEVGEEAMDGLEILRRKGMMGQKTDEELYFMLSMYTSYSGHYEATIGGGNYFMLDKGFIVGIVGTVLSYFVILMQFNPPLTLTSPKDLGLRIDSRILLSTAEGTRLFGRSPENISLAIMKMIPKDIT